MRDAYCVWARGWVVMIVSFVVTVLAVPTRPAQAAELVATQSGLWSDVATWGGVGVPQSGDDVHIPANIGVTIHATLNRSATTRVEGRLDIVNAATVTFNRGLINTGQITSENGTAMVINAYVENYNRIALSGTLRISLGANFFNYGTLSSFYAISNSGYLENSCGATVIGTVSSRPATNLPCTDLWATATCNGSDLIVTIVAGDRYSGGFEVSGTTNGNAIPPMNQAGLGPIALSNAGNPTTYSVTVREIGGDRDGTILIETCAFEMPILVPFSPTPAVEGGENGVITYDFKGDTTGATITLTASPALQCAFVGGLSTYAGDALSRVEVVAVADAIMDGDQLCTVSGIFATNSADYAAGTMLPTQDVLVIDSSTPRTQNPASPDNAAALSDPALVVGLGVTVGPFLPNMGTVNIFAAGPTPLYDAPNGGPLRINQVTMWLPQDIDGSGFDAMQITAIQAIDGDVWLGLWLGSANWAWIVYDSATMQLSDSAYTHLYNAQ